MSATTAQPSIVKETLSALKVGVILVTLLTVALLSPLLLVGAAVVGYNLSLTVALIVGGALALVGIFVAVSAINASEKQEQKSYAWVIGVTAIVLIGLVVATGGLIAAA
jgi:hypothetical protein